MPLLNKRIIRLWLCLVPATCLGCAQKVRPTEIGFDISSREDVLRIKRVVFVELACDGYYPQIAEGMTEALFRAIQGKKIFHVDVVRMSDPVCRDLPLRKREPHTIKELRQMREGLKCDAVLFGSISAFRPYPRMQIALYLRLLDLNRGKFVWGVDHVWDTTDKDTEGRISTFLADRMRSGYTPMRERMVLISPRVFQKFVAHEVVGTLPSQTFIGPEARAGSSAWVGGRNFRKMWENLKKL